MFTLSDPAELSTLEVPGWSTRNGEKIKWKTMVTTRTKRAPSWLRSGKGGALSAAFHKKSTFILAGLVSHFRLRFAGVASRFASVTSAKWLR